jgi:hypothetical protein
MMERKRECRELHEICSRLGNLGRRLRFPVYLGKELLETPIEELELSVRSFNCLRRAGMATVGDLVQNIDTREDLLKIRNFGRRSADEIMDAIMEYQYTILPDGVAYGILHDMGMEGPIIRIVCIPEHGIKKPVGGKPVFGYRHGELNELYL